MKKDKAVVTNVVKWELIILVFLSIIALTQSIPESLKIEWALTENSRIMYGWLSLFLGAVVACIISALLSACMALFASVIGGGKAYAVKALGTTFRQSVLALWGAYLLGTLIGVGADVMLLPLALYGLLVAYVFKNYQTSKRQAKKTVER
jgi:hypothetical protein